MDCGGVDEPPYYGGWDHDGYGGYGGYEGGEGEADETDLNALTNSGCHRRGGKGHFSRECPTPKGKGKGGKGDKGKGKGGKYGKRER